MPPPAIAAGGIMFSGCPSVRLCVRLSVRIVNAISWTDGRISTKLCMNVTYGRPTIWLGFQGQRVKGQGHAVMTQKFLWARYLLNRWTDFDQTLHECHLWSPHDLIRFSRSTGQMSRSRSDDPKILVGAISPEPVDGFRPNFARMSPMVAPRSD